MPPDIFTRSTFLILTILVSRQATQHRLPSLLSLSNFTLLEQPLSLLCPYPSRPFWCIWQSEPPDSYFLLSGSGCLRLCSLPALILLQRPYLPMTWRGSVSENLVHSLLGSLKDLPWIPSISLCTSTLSALSFTHMAFPTTATQMTPN